MEEKMKVAGIIAEYNPFHEGHRYHIEETRRQTGADYIIVVMSGDFVQRGEPAVVDKYVRTEMALRGGADLVIELPVCYATASAEYFATGAVGILQALNCVETLSFGSEWAGAGELSHLAEIMVEEPPLYKETLRKHLREGGNYPQAREKAIIACCPEEKYARILESPNHILGVEYLKALYRKQSTMKPLTVKRKGSAYHARDWEEGSDQYPSASSLRELLKKGGNDEIIRRGSRDADLFLEAYKAGDCVNWEDLMPFLDYFVLLKKKVLGKYFGMDYDISRRIGHLYEPGLRFDELLSVCHSRNYTDAALRRVFLHMVLGIKDYPFFNVAGDIPIPYARILGLKKSAGRLLSHMRECSGIPVIQRTVEGKQLEKTDSVGHMIYEIDLRCANLYEQIASRKAGRKFRNEYRRNAIILSRTV